MALTTRFNLFLVWSKLVQILTKKSSNWVRHNQVSWSSLARPHIEASLRDGLIMETCDPIINSKVMVMYSEWFCLVVELHWEESILYSSLPSEFKQYFWYACVPEFQNSKKNLPGDFYNFILYIFSISKLLSHVFIVKIPVSSLVAVRSHLVVFARE